MNLKDILSISGEGGLFKFVAQGKNAIIIEHLESAKRTVAHGTAKVNSLEDIAVFTENEEVPLSKIFDKIFEKENGGPSIDQKSSPDQLVKYFEEIIPDFDRQRVYNSDIKKIIGWYNFLQKLNLLVIEDEKEEKEENEEGVQVEKKPMKKTPAHKEASRKEVHVKKSTPKQSAGKKNPVKAVKSDKGK